MLLDGQEEGDAMTLTTNAVQSALPMVSVGPSSSSQHNYRESRLYPADSSSPLRSSSPPSSPPLSPTPHPFYGRISSRSSDPFAASVKTSLESKASLFGSSDRALASDEPGSPSQDRQMRSIALRGKKRGYPISPQKVDEGNGGGGGGGAAAAGRNAYDECDQIMSDEKRASLVVRQLPSSAASRVLGNLFSEGTSSEDHNSSDDQLEWGIGLKDDRLNTRSGLAPAFEIPRSSAGPPPFPTSGSRGPADPLSAFGQSPSRSFSRTASSGPAAQRRRLVGTSPQKLSRASKGAAVDSSGDEGPFPHWEQLGVSVPSSESFWQSKVSQVWDKNEAKLILDGLGLERIHPVVADLSKYVHLLPSTHHEEGSFSRSSSFARSASFARTTSRTGNDAGLEGSPKSPSTKNLTRTLSQAETKAPQLYLSNNALTRLPSALFHIHNLTVLTLRNNKLKMLPPAIGELQNLRELNVAGNDLRYLPSEILKLRLVHFVHFPNPFMQPPNDGAKLSVRPSLGATGRRLLSGPKKSISSHTAPPVTPAPPPTDAVMGPPALPTHILSRARTLQRTRSDVQMEELLESGLSMLGTSVSSSQPPSQLTSETNSSTAGPSSSSSRSSAVVSTTTPLAASAAARLFGARSVSFAHVPARKDAARITTEARETALKQEVEAMDMTESRARYLESASNERLLPSLRECCMRVLLSPDIHCSSDATGDNSFSKQTTSPLAALKAAATSHRPTTLLESYEAGTLRTLRFSLDVKSARALECARRSFTNAWGGSSTTRTFSRGSSSGASSGVSGRGTIGRKGKQRSSSSKTWLSGAHFTLPRNDDDDGGYGSSWSARSDIRPQRSINGYIADAELRSSPTSPPSSPLAASYCSSAHQIPAADMEADLAQGDDAAENPYFSRCPNPGHARDKGITWSVLSSRDAGGKNGSGWGGEGLPRYDKSTWADWPLPTVAGGNGTGGDVNFQIYGGPVFLQPAETRIEWVSHVGGISVAHSNISTAFSGPASTTAAAPSGVDVDGESATTATMTQTNAESSETPSPAQHTANGSGCLPVLWRGCSVGCLDFLEVAHAVHA